MKVTVDIHNPAEVFACFGIFELLSQRDNKALAYFDGEGTGQSSFIVDTTATLPDLRTLKIETLEHDNPLIAPVSIDGLRLDWWLSQWRTDASNLKLWSGTTKASVMLRNFQADIPDFDEAILQQSLSTKTGKSSFGFDLRADRDAVKLGYSPDDLQEAVVIYPATELLCAVGLQNFRPSSESAYDVWRRPIPRSIAHAACRMNIPGLRQSKFTMKIKFISKGGRAVSEVSTEQEMGAGA